MRKTLINALATIRQSIVLHQTTVLVLNGDMTVICRANRAERTDEYSTERRIYW